MSGDKILQKFITKLLGYIRTGLGTVLISTFMVMAPISAPVLAGTPSGMSSSEIDALVARAMETFTVPGMAIGVIKDGKILHSKGYGVLEAGKSSKVTSDTLFAIASNSKAFTTAAISILVDDGKMSWDDKVIDYIPEFQMYDAWVTREFTIRDLVIHNSGLGLGAGDLMFWPSTGFSREEIIHNLRYLKPVTSFRTEYAYDNLLYIVAGEVIGVVSGQSFEDFVDNRIIRPLGMDRCAANKARLKGEPDIAEPHAVIEGKLQKVERLQAPHEQATLAAAGGLMCSVSSMLKWQAMHLENGALPNGEALISKTMHDEMWSPQTILKAGDFSKDHHGTNFSSYGLGWGINDMHGLKVVKHSGGLLGMITQVVMVPELNLGVLVFTNQQNGGALNSVYLSILKSFMDAPQIDWIKKFDDYYTARRAQAEKAVVEAASANKASGEPALPLAEYVGAYKDPWFGVVDITEQDGQLYFTSQRSAKLKGVMEPFNATTFIVRWDDRTLEADAYVKFDSAFSGGVSGMKMKAVSDLTDFSFDFHDLDFSKVE